MAEAQKKDDFEFEIEGEDQGKPLENEVEARVQTPQSHHP